MKFTIGSDPEFFIENFDGTITRSEEFTSGTKDVPEEMSDGYSCQADNIMIELSLPAATSCETWVSGLNKGISMLREKIMPCRLLIEPHVVFDGGGFVREKDKEVGCEPDFNAYTLSENPSVKYEGNDRFAGGHIHVGFVDRPSDEEIVEMVKAMDCVFMGMVCIQDTNLQRKEVYGTPGRFRYKPYGFEYRSLSNFWLKSNKQMEQVYSNVNKVVTDYKQIITSENLDKVHSLFQKNLHIKERGVFANLIK